MYNDSKSKTLSSKAIYVDNSATTRVRDEVLNAMKQAFEADFGNPSSVHQFGRKAKLHLEEARKNIASLINAKEEQIFFTSGGTESDNLIIFGIERAIEAELFNNKEKHIISTKIEHHAIKDPLEYLEKKGWKVTWLSVDKEGFIDLEELKSTITPKTVLVSIIHANNEIGTIQDINKVSELCREKNVLFHTDAVQSFGKIPLDVEDLKLDFMSMSSHKIYGPKGVGALFIRNKEKLFPLFIGGGQENKIRPGTENIPGIVGFGVASKLLKEEIYVSAKKLRKLQINLMEDLSKIENVILTGVCLEKVKENYRDEKFFYRVPGHVSLCVLGVEGESLVLQMDLRGIACSSGSACTTANHTPKLQALSTPLFEPSHVLLACGVPSKYAKGSLRLTLGRENTEEDVAYIVDSVKAVVALFQKKEFAKAVN